MPLWLIFFFKIKLYCNELANKEKASRSEISQTQSLHISTNIIYTVRRAILKSRSFTLDFILSPLIIFYALIHHTNPDKYITELKLEKKTLALYPFLPHTPHIHIHVHVCTVYYVGKGTKKDTY